jgi:hypothetical protein
MAGSVDGMRDGPTGSSLSEAERRDRDDRAKAIGGAMMLGGAVLIAVGVPVLVTGLRKRPVDPELATPIAPRLAARPTGLALTF